MNKSRIKFGALLAVVLIMSMALVPAVSAREKSHSIKANDLQLEIIKQLWGQNITMGEYMEKVIPDVLKDVPKEAVEQLYATEVVWPGLSETNTSTTSSEVQSQFVIVINHNSNIDATWPTVTSTSSSRVWLPTPWTKMPYMAVWTYLLYQNGDNEELIGAKFDDGSNVYEVEASDSYSISSAGNYKVTGYHYGTHPPNYNPPAYAAYSDTGWSYVSP